MRAGCSNSWTRPTWRRRGTGPSWPTTRCCRRRPTMAALEPGAGVEGDPWRMGWPALTVGETVSGRLGKDSELLDEGSYADYYVVYGEAGQRVVLEWHSADFDAPDSLQRPGGTGGFGRRFRGWYQRARRDDVPRRRDVLRRCQRVL